MRRHAETATNPAAGNPTASPAIATTASVVVPAQDDTHPEREEQQRDHHQDAAGREKNLREQHDDPEREQDQGEGQVVHSRLDAGWSCD